MSRPTLQALLAQAAELRAVGYTWPAIARRVHRKARTCQQWPRRHVADWDFHYQAARLRRFEETSEEAHTRLHGLLRSEDEKVRLKAIDLWIRNGSGVYDKLGQAASFAAYRLDQAELRRGGPAIERFWGRAERKVHALRAAAGQPPLTPDEWEEVEGAIAEAREARRPWLPAALAAFPPAQTGAPSPAPPTPATGGLSFAISLLLAILVVGRGGPGLPDHDTAARGTGFQLVRIGRAETLPIRAAGSDRLETRPTETADGPLAVSIPRQNAPPADDPDDQRHAPESHFAPLPIRVTLPPTPLSIRNGNSHMRTAPVLALALCFAMPALAEPDRVTGANYPLAAKFNRDFVYQHVREATVIPTFIGKTDQFWYGVRTPNGTRYYRIDPTRKTREPLFDTARLAAQLSEAVQKPVDTDTLAITRVTVTDDGAKMRFVHTELQFEYEFGPAKLTKLGKAAPAPRPFPKGDTDERTREMIERMREERDRIEKEDDRKDERKDDVKKDEDRKDEEKKDDGKADPKGGPRRSAFDYKAYSPDRKRYVYAQKHNLYLAEEGKEAEAAQLTTDGEEDYSFSSFGARLGGQRGRTDRKIPAASDRKVRPIVTWSPDSKGFFVTRTDGRGVKDLYLVDSLAQPRPTLSEYRYPMPGEDNVFKSELLYCDAAAKKVTKVAIKYPYESYWNIHWNKTGDELRFVRRDRPLRHLEFCTLNTKTGEAKCILGEGFDAAYLEFQPARYVDESDEMVWWSERSGWGHFYLYGRDGKLKNPITGGAWRASRIVDVDAKNRLLYFVGNGREDGENIYYDHMYRVRFDGTDLTLLDPSDTCFTHHDEHCRGANHQSYLSPSRRYVVTTCSRVDSPPMSYVLDEKGGRVMDLEKTDLTALEKTGWKLPETFCVKAADGVTTLWGNLWKPFDFDPKKKYPVIAHVYPGPQQEGVTHTFSAYGNNQQLAQLGFIVVQVGHRGGAPTRSKAYHSYGYYNLRDYALADKKAAIEQLAARNPYIDLDRVGIYGHSGGGFLSAAALLQKPFNEFFKVAVASAGNHDNNIYNDKWSERYHGLKEVPVETKDAAEKKIPPGKPDEDEEDEQDEPQDKKVEAKKDDKKVEAKKDDVKKDEAKKVEAKKVEDKKSDATKVKYEIKVPTNAELAANLKGHLLLVHGDMDNNVHPANTLRLVDALIKANKRFDMLILPGKPHAFGDEQPYFTQRMWDFFSEHLLEDRQTGADIYEKKPGRR